MASKTDDQNAAAAKRNAFSELMSSKSKPNPQPKSQPIYDRGNGLLPYIVSPGTFPPSTVLTYTEHTVLIRDLYPKSTIHLLLLPRDPTKINLHPHAAFQDPQFLALIKSEAAHAVTLAASELSRLMAPHSASSCQARDLGSQDPLPPARDFSTDLLVGVHAHPSMNHLHVHVVSRDMHSSAMRHRKHYNSFNTEFFIPLAEYPLAEADERRKTRVQNENLARDFVCWRCGRAFGNRFARLKDHLEEEFEAWRKEMS